MKEMVNHPSHYGGADNVYEVIKIIDAYKLNFDLGNVIKYVLRAGEKDDIVQDLEKAKWYLQHEIDLIKGEREKEVTDVLGYVEPVESVEETKTVVAKEIKKAKVVLNEDAKPVKTLI